MKVLLIIVIPIVVILMVKMLIAEIKNDDNTGPFDFYVPGGR
jgi:hypothetical protein